MTFLKKWAIMAIMVCVVITALASAVLWIQYGAVCNPAVVDHLHKYSNLFDEGFDGEFVINDIGLPFGVTELGIRECVNRIVSKNAVPDL